MRDADRPPVLAHEHFLNHREALAGLPLPARFGVIHDTNLWGADTSASGLGSEVSATVVLQSELPSLLKELQVRSLLDAPCGDAGWIARLDLSTIEYTGVDIVPQIIASNIADRFSLGAFAVADIVVDPLPAADAALCRDCLVHLSFDNIRRAIENFRRTGARWLITTTFPQWQDNADCEDGDWRALNLERPPFSWPKPVISLNEQCQEAGGGWKDKSLAVWRLQELAVG